MLGAAIEAMAEAFSLVRKYGVVPQVLFDVMTDALFAAPAYKIYGKIMVDQSYDKAGFMTLQGLKDLNLVLAAADQARVPMPSANNVRDRLLGAIAHGDGEKDWAVMARSRRGHAGWNDFQIEELRIGGGEGCEVSRPSLTAILHS